jgi:hypothetical protein
MEAKHYGSYKFTPKINRKSRTMGRSVSFSDKVSQSSKTDRYSTATDRGSEKEELSFTYKPTICEKSRDLSSDYAKV